MKNREFRMLVAGTLLAALTVGSLAGSPVYAKEKEQTAQTSESTSVQTDKKDNTKKETAKSSTKPVKDETVYAKIGANGTVKSVIVSDQLNNVENVSEIKDMSVLKEIQNVKGDENFSSSGQNLVWEGDGQNIVYQGTTDKTLPVGLDITYTLDGKEISAEEMEGKSGHLVMRYTYKNTSEEENGTYVPFLMATGMLLDEEVFSNVSVTNGKLISDGSKNMAIGLGMPNMQEKLGTDILEIPSYFEVEADVTNYQTPEAITVATNDMFNELEADQFDSVSDLKGSMSELQNAADQLVSGSGELKAGLDTLLSSSGTLTSGIQALANGGTALETGTLTLTEGAQQVAAGLGTASDKVTSVLVPGAEALDTGVSQMQQQLETQLPALSGGIETLYTGINSVAQGMESLNGNMGTIAAGAQSVSQGINAIAANTGTLYGGAEAVYTYLSGISTTDAGIADTTSSQDEITTLQNLIASGTVTGETAEELEAVIGSLSADQQTRDTVNSQRAAQTSGVPQEVLGAAEAVKNGLYTFDQSFQGEKGLAAGAQNLSTALSAQGAVGSGIAQLDAALNKGEPSTGTPSIVAGMESLKTAVSGDNGLAAQVSAGMAQIKGGTSGILEGVAGENGLSSGLSALYAGAGQVSAGAESLYAGAGTLTDGLGTLQTGSGTLIDGVTQLDEGAGTLNDGMIQFNEEGIEKLVDVFSGDVGNLLDKMNEMLENSRGYNNFSGIADGMDGNVKFIFVSE